MEDAESGAERAEAKVESSLTHRFAGDPDPRFRCHFDIALVFLRLGYKIRRTCWPEEDSLCITGGIVETVGDQRPITMFPIADVLADDWTVAVK